MDIFLRYAKRIVLVANIVIGCNVGVVIAGSIAFAQTSMLMKQWEKIFIVELVYIHIYLSIYMINIYRLYLFIVIYIIY